ncbi:MAG: HEAT repeat domain-containing protein [Rubripirellula sp.]|jgi:tetratricopeptide (TPR) repeat protein
MTSTDHGAKVTSPALKSNRLATAYRRYLSTADSAAFAWEVDEHYSQLTLLTLLERGESETRRAAALALGILGNQRAVSSLARALNDDDRGVRLSADDSFRAILLRDCAPVHHQHLLRVMHLNDGGEYQEAFCHAESLVSLAPRFAEAHHQLAISWHGMGNHFQAEGVYRSCLWHCRFHYPAWQGLARCRIELGDNAGALMALRRALDICPDLESVRLQIRTLRRKMRRADS